MNQGLHPMAVANTDAFLGAFGEVVGDRRKLLANATDAMPDLLATEGVTTCIGHGDFRLDNMRYDGEAIVVFDWQLILATWSSWDVMYFVAMSLTTEQRRAWESDLVARYVTKLRARAGDVLSIDDAHDGFRLALQFYCGLLPVVSTLDVTVNDRAWNLGCALVDRALTAAQDHGIT
jgi:aminoglycoside phosphotransferase (APT) family kinase protein